MPHKSKQPSAKVIVRKTESLESALHSYKAWAEGTTENRKLMRRDSEFRHGNQWTERELSILKERGQPALTENLIGKKLNYLVGQEIRNRVDPKARPRTPMHDSETRAATDALRFIAETEDADAVFTASIDDLYTVGLCGAVIEPEVTGPPQGQEETPEQDALAQSDINLRLRGLSWDRQWWDPHSRKLDFSDARYKGVLTWWDIEEAIEFYAVMPGVNPDYIELLKQTRENSGNQDDSETFGDTPVGWYDPKRKRILIVEKYQTLGRDCYVSHFTESGYIVDPRPTGLLDETGKRHICPLIMASAFVDSQGNRYGLARPMISPQEAINKRESKALHLLNTEKLLYEEDAVDNPETLRRERTKPDALLRFRPGALGGGKVQFERNTELASSHIALLNSAKQSINSVGPDLPTQGQAGAMSGRELQLRNEIGSLEIEPVKDSHRRFKRAVYRQIWLGVRQFWRFQKWLRVTDEGAEDGYRFVGLNINTTKGKRLVELIDNGAGPAQAMTAVGIPEQVIPQLIQAANQAGGFEQLAGLPILREPYKTADVARLDVDILIDEVPDAATIQHEEVKELREIMQSYLSAGQQLPPEFLLAIVEASSLRNKDKVRAILQPKPDPQAAEMAQAMQQIQQQLAGLEVALKQAQVMETQADAQLKGAKAAGEAQAAGVEVQKVISEAQHDRSISRLHDAQAMKHEIEANALIADRLRGVEPEPELVPEPEPVEF